MNSSTDLSDILQYLRSPRDRRKSSQRTADSAHSRTVRFSIDTPECTSNNVSTINTPSKDSISSNDTITSRKDTVTHVPIDATVTHLPIEVTVTHVPVDATVTHLPTDVTVTHLPIDATVTHTPSINPRMFISYQCNETDASSVKISFSKSSPSCFESPVSPTGYSIDRDSNGSIPTIDRTISENSLLLIKRM